jgi:Protein of unknown function (DUF2817)
MTLTASFAHDYQSARTLFTEAVRQCGGEINTCALTSVTGMLGEPLSMDWTVLGPADASNLLVVTSGIHGVEGFCGSGCQVALMHGSDLLRRLLESRTALLLIHAINPYGFSHLQRGNEENVDLNRNFRKFPQERASPEVDADYRVLHPLLVPAEWPPNLANEDKLRYIQVAWGRVRYRRALMSGQGCRTTGLFYTGNGVQWSNETLRGVLRSAGRGRQRVAWIDIHSGLGENGHAEKIHGGRSGREELQRARAIWGLDVFDPFDPATIASPAVGVAGSCVYDECEHAQIAALVLEFGTVSFEQMLLSLRGAHWLREHQEAPAKTVQDIQRAMRDAFYVDSDEWRGMVFAQTRAAVGQAIKALTHSQLFAA